MSCQSFPAGLAVPGDVKKNMVVGKIEVAGEGG